jgi:hypothetical protein
MRAAGPDVFSLSPTFVAIIKTMMDWVPVVFITFKVLVFGTGMFFAIKWHHEQAKKGRQTDTRATLRTVGKVAAIFVPSVVILLLITFAVSKKLGLT